MYCYVILSNVFQLMRMKMCIHYLLLSRWLVIRYVCFLLFCKTLYCTIQLFILLVSIFLQISLNFLSMIINEVLGMLFKVQYLHHLDFRYKNINLFIEACLQFSISSQQLQDNSAHCRIIQHIGRMFVQKPLKIFMQSFIQLIASHLLCLLLFYSGSWNPTWIEQHITGQNCLTHLF